MNITQIRARLSRAKENVKRDPWYVSTNVYIADVGELLEEVDRLTAILKSVSDTKALNPDGSKIYVSSQSLLDKTTVRAITAETKLAATQKQLEDLSENGFCASCNGCNAPVNADKIKWCTDWKWRGERSGENG